MGASGYLGEKPKFLNETAAWAPNCPKMTPKHAQQYSIVVVSTTVHYLGAIRSFWGDEKGETSPSVFTKINFDVMQIFWNLMYVHMDRHWDTTSIYTSVYKTVKCIVVLFIKPVYSTCIHRINFNQIEKLTYNKGWKVNFNSGENRQTHTHTVTRHCIVDAAPFAAKNNLFLKEKKIYISSSIQTMVW